MNSPLSDHLKTGSTTVCRAWKVARHDGEVLGFTDHDRDLAFDGVIFLARTGLTARALQQSTGMSVDNTEAMGALSDASVREEDIMTGRYDDAQVTIYLVNWFNVAEREIQFRGSFGEITRSKGMFQVELRGLTEKLNRPIGRVYQAACSAILGDKACAINLGDVAYCVETNILALQDGRIFTLPALSNYTPRWFEYGKLTVLSGAGKDQTGTIRSDQVLNGTRKIDLWQGFSVAPVAGDLVSLTVGCDKRGSTCRDRFNNFPNFRGFPHIPGDDWLRAVPRPTQGG